MEEKLKTTKTITVNNSREKRIISKIPLNTHTWVTTSLPENSVTPCVQIYIKHCTKAFRGRLRLNPLGELTAIFQPLAELRGRKGCWRETEEKEKEGSGKGSEGQRRKGRGRHGKGGRCPLLSDFLATPMGSSKCITSKWIKIHFQPD